MPTDPAVPVPPPLPRLLEVWEAAHILKASPEYVRRLIREHRLPAVRLGSRSLRIHPEDLAWYIEACRIGHRQPGDRDHRATPRPRMQPFAPQASA